ncbi:MAG: DciA family protein [Pseudomonadota bacterium]
MDGKVGKGGERRFARGGAPREKDHAAPKPVRRRRKLFAAVGAEVTAPLARAAEGKGFADAEVLLRWSEIMGAALAPLCRPVRLTHGRGRDLTRTLIVEADGSAALEVEHRATQIIERVNACFGYRHVTRLRVTQVGQVAAGIAGLSEPAAPFAGYAATGSARRRGEPHVAHHRSEEAEAAARRRADGIVNDALKDALSDLGAYILEEKRSGEPSASPEQGPRRPEDRVSAPETRTRRDR